MSRTAVAAITYRANALDGRELVIRLRCAPEAATLADAWSRLVVIDPGVDPTSIEIEIREAVPARRHPAREPKMGRAARGHRPTACHATASRVPA